MTPLGFHVNFKLRDRRVLSPNVASHRRAAAGVLKAAEPFALLAFRITDTHAHFEVMEDRTRAVEAIRRVKLALRARLGLNVPFADEHFEPLLDQHHVSSAFTYIMRQEASHGFGHDHYAEASNLPDLLGMRLAGVWTARQVRQWLPGMDRETLLGFLGVDEVEALPVTAAELHEATLAASALQTLAGRKRGAHAARCAAVHAAEGKNAELAEVLGVTPRSIPNLRRHEPDPALVRAIRQQADLRRRKPAEQAEFVNEPFATCG